MRLIFSVLVYIGLGGCLEKGQPLVVERSPVFNNAAPKQIISRPAPRHYTVRNGDTLYSIAWRFEYDYLSLARANGVSAPYVIHPGQTLRLTTQLPKSQRLVQTAPAAVSSSAAKFRPPTAPRPETHKWVWPLNQKPDVEYGKSSKGMDFAVAGGDANSTKVRAAGAGEVVYAGNGIGGFERLVIIKHGSDLLSAYSFNGLAMVKEQQRVKAGEWVADIKNRGRLTQTLHFELRRDGEPINPRSVLR